jgi:hypothetical protein
MTKTQNPAVASQRARQGGLWLIVLVVVSILALVGVGYVVKDPRRRRRAMHKVGKTWVRVEDTAQRAARKLRRKGDEIEREARALVVELWKLVDDHPFESPREKILPVVNQFYGHGAFMGAAPALLNDSKWRRILAFLMPDVYRDVQEAVVKGSRPGELIPMFENNPVMCAFGVWQGTLARRGGEARGPMDLAGMEWDVFVSTDLVDAWEDARDDDRGPIVEKLVDTMVIAHASTTDTVQEQFGLCQWADVRKTAKTKFGGVEPVAWMDLFARGLLLAEDPDLDGAIGRMVELPRVHSPEACRDHTFEAPLPVAQAVDVYRRVTGKDHFSVVLEIKSLRTTPLLLAEIVETLNRRTVHVAAVGSFLSEEIDGLDQITQVVREETLPGPRPILFLHFAGDLQRACDRGTIAPGTHAMFNGASLLVARADGRSFTYRIDEDVVAEVAEYRERFDLQIGIYVQENDCDVAAAGLLSEIVRQHPETFALGFAWGGLHDEVSIAGGQGDHRGFGSQRLLERLGVARTSKVKARKGPKGPRSEPQANEEN